MGRYLLLLFLSMVSVCAHSEVFYWRIAYPDGQFRYESAEAACQANNDYYRKDYGSGYSRIEVRNKPIDETHWSCYLYAYKLDSRVWNILRVSVETTPLVTVRIVRLVLNMIQLQGLQGQ
ncbi:hypothetical protein P7I89_05960 [Pseudomonas aeruginosa]|nr:hypothetical protein P7I89_05960 [Pseudomonas aeruginosa]